MYRIDDKKNKIPLLKDFNKLECITQLDICIDNDKAYWPQLLDYEQLYNENKKTIFILNKRNPEKLMSSFKRWKYKNISFFDRFHMYNPELFDGTEEDFIRIVNLHYDTIETFFRFRPESKFISYDIDHDTVDKLKLYINLHNVTEFPKLNVNQI